ncbi:hypothetical protein EXS74_01170 [Candidatus Woesearchaeota archaeon]|nr:hypothetical protein [Candidatus Woesearchaeota archaeon]
MVLEKVKRLYVKVGQHSREEGVSFNDHVVIFASRGFRSVNLDHLTERYSLELPVTVVTTTCPVVGDRLKTRGYSTINSDSSGMPYNENIF